MAKIRLAGLSAAEPAGPMEAVPAGIYGVKCVEWENRESSEKKLPMLGLTYEVVESPTDQTLLGRKIFDNMVLASEDPKKQEQVNGFVKARLVCFGVKTDANDSFDPDEFKGATGKIRVDVEEYKKDANATPMKVNRIKEYYPKVTTGTTPAQTER